MDFKNKLKKNKLLAAAVVFVKRHQKALKIWAFVIVVGAMVFKGIVQQPQITANREKIARLNEQLAYEQQRSEEVDHLKEIVGTDEYIEKMAREKLGLIKENEKVFVDVSKNN